MDASEFLKNIESIIKLVGGGIAGLGLFTLILAIKEQNPSVKSNAFMEIGAGLVLIALSDSIMEFIIQFFPS